MKQAGEHSRASSYQRLKGSTCQAGVVGACACEAARLRRNWLSEAQVPIGAGLFARPGNYFLFTTFCISVLAGFGMDLLWQPGKQPETQVFVKKMGLWGLIIVSVGLMCSAAIAPAPSPEAQSRVVTIVSNQMIAGFFFLSLGLLLLVLTQRLADRLVQETEKLVFRPDKYSLVGQSRGVTVYLNQSFVPRAHVSPRTLILPTGIPATSFMASSGFVPSEMALVEHSLAQNLPATLASPAPVVFLEAENFTSKSPEGRVVHFPQAWNQKVLAGWGNVAGDAVTYRVEVSAALSTPVLICHGDRPPRSARRLPR